MDGSLVAKHSRRTLNYRWDTSFGLLEHCPGPGVQLVHFSRKPPLLARAMAGGTWQRWFRRWFMVLVCALAGTFSATIFANDCVFLEADCDREGAPEECQ